MTDHGASDDSGATISWNGNRSILEGSQGCRGQYDSQPDSHSSGSHGRGANGRIVSEQVKNRFTSRHLVRAAKTVANERPPAERRSRWYDEGPLKGAKVSEPMALATGLGGTLFADAPDTSAYGSPETAEPYWFAPAELVVSDVNESPAANRTDHGILANRPEWIGFPSKR